MVRTILKIAGGLFVAGAGIVAAIYGAESAMEEFETAVGRDEGDTAPTREAA